MNAAQLQLYWYEWRACAEALKKLGKRCDDEMRKTIQRSALAERTKSSKELSNAELTAVLAKFRSFSRPGDFDAQMHAQAEPEAVLDDLKNRCADAANAILLPKIKDMGHRHSAAGRYVDSTAERLFKHRGELTAREWQVLCGVLEASARRAPVSRS